MLLASATALMSHDSGCWYTGIRFGHIDPCEGRIVCDRPQIVTQRPQTYCF